MLTKKARSESARAAPLQKSSVPRLAPLGPISWIQAENSAVLDLPNPPFSFLPTPPLRVSHRSVISSGNLLERSFSLPGGHSQSFESSQHPQLRTLVRSWNNCSYSPQFLPEQSPEHAFVANLAHPDDLSGSLSAIPMADLVLGPHHPPFPLELVPVQRRTQEYALFPDAFTEYMEGRMSQFRPVSSQNNVESSLNNGHPYQQQPDMFHLGPNRRSTKATMWLVWFNSNYPRQDGPIAQSPPEPDSSCSFLPRNQNLSVEPHPVHMEYTAQAVPIVEVRKSPTTSHSHSCGCF